MTFIPTRSTALIALLWFAALAGAEVKEPPRAEKLDIQIRYRIRADRDERIRQYRALVKHLDSLGFVDTKKGEPDHDLDILDPNAEYFTGTIPSKNVMEVLKDRHVQQILFAPSAFAYPEPSNPVAVKLGLRSGYRPAVQQQLHQQVVAHLGLLGFQEALGYDTQGYTLVRGSLPRKNVDLLVKDIRSEPSGWFVPAVSRSRLPEPLRDGNPIRWAEVVPIKEFLPPFTPAPILPAQLRYTADLRAALLDPKTKGTPLLIEVVYARPIKDVPRLREHLLGNYGGAALDGVIGNVASVRISRLDYVDRFAQEEGVLGVRLPRRGSETIAIGAPKGATPTEVLAATNVNELHKLRYKGAGVKVVVIGSNFTGAEQLVGNGLPKKTTIVDLTTELSPSLIPAPTEPARSGTGTAAARALAVAAPECELVLVRIDPGSYFHLLTILRLARGEISTTDALEVRLTELSARSAEIDRDRDAAISAYRTAFADLSDNPVSVNLRKKARADLEAVYAREKQLTVLVRRFNEYKATILTTFRGAKVFVNTLVWESGYPLDGLNSFAATLDRLSAPLPPRIVNVQTIPKPPVSWVQSGSAAGAAAWGGLFRDTNGDSLMEWLSPGVPLPADNWSSQLNFLGTRAPSGEVKTELAQGTRLRLVVQWREPADPTTPESETPANALTLRLMRQIDPDGAQRSSDEMQEVARSASVPNIIYRTPTFLVFEQMLEFTVPVAGRYAVALESNPGSEPRLPILRRHVEIHPRLVVETPGTALSAARVVFRSYTNMAAGVGTPGDAEGAVTLGMIGARQQVGAGTGVELRQKPDLFGPPAMTLGGQATRGQGVATAFTGGTAALLVQARFRGPNVFKSAGIEEGANLVIPERWFRPTKQPQPKP